MENEELVQKIQEGHNTQKYIEKLYTQNTGFIYTIAKKYEGYAEIEDLMQEAYFAVLDAAKCYDFERGRSFLSYLPYQLKSHFQKYLENCGRMARIPVHMQGKVKKYNDYMKQCAAYNYDPSDAAICRELNLTKKQLSGVRETIYQSSCISIDDMVQEDEDVTVGDCVADPYDMEADAIEAYDSELLKERLWKAVDTLTDAQSKVIIDKYKLSLQLKQIAEALNLKPGRVRQIERKALEILKRKREIRELAKDYDYIGSKGYRGSVGSFKQHGNSIVEHLAMKEIEQEEQKQDEVNELINETVSLAIK